MMMRDAGGKDTSLLSKRLNEIIHSDASFEEMLVDISKVYEESTKPWILSGDDGVLSRMRNISSSFLETAVRAELKSLSNDMKNVIRMDAIEGIIHGIGWLPDGFRSSLKADIAFARANLCIEDKKKAKRP